MSKALPALMVVLGLLLLIATLYDVAVRVNPSLIPSTLLAPNPLRGGVLTKTVTRTAVKLEPINASLLSRWYPLPFEALLLDLSNASPDTLAKVVAHINYSEGILRNVTVTVTGRVKPEAWNSTVMVYVNITFSPPLPNGTEAEVIPVQVTGTWWPTSFGVSQHHLLMQGNVSRLSLILCYYRQHLPSLTLFVVRLTYLSNLSTSDSFLLLIKVGMPISVTGSLYWMASIRLSGDSTLPPPALLPLKDGGVLLASIVEVRSACYVTVIKFSPDGRVLKAVSLNVVKHCLSGDVELRPLGNGYLLALGDLAARRVTLIRLSSFLGVVKAIALTLPPDMLSWSVATLGDRVYVTLTWMNAPYVAFLVLDEDLALVKALAYSIGFPPNNLTPAETWCSISGVNDDLILVCMPSPPPSNPILPKVLRTPVLVARISGGDLKDFRFFLFDGVGMILPSVVKLGDEYMLMTFINIINDTRTKGSALLITLSQDLRLEQAKLMNVTPLCPELLRLGMNRVVLVGTVNSTPYVVLLGRDGNVVNAVPQGPGQLFGVATKNNTIYLVAQEARALNNTVLTLVKFPASKINSTTVTLIATMQAQVTQQTTGNHVTAEPLPSTASIRIRDVTNYVTTQPARPQVTVTPIDPR